METFINNIVYNIGFKKCQCPAQKSQNINKIKGRSTVLCSNQYTPLWYECCSFNLKKNIFRDLPDYIMSLFRRINNKQA